MAADKEVLLKKTKSLLRAVLASSDEVKASELQADYEMVTLESLPFRELGFPTVETFMHSVPDVAIISRNRSGEVVYKEAPSEATEHIKHLMKAKKKSSKAKPKQKIMRRPVQSKTAFSAPKHMWNKQMQNASQASYHGHHHVPHTEHTNQPAYSISNRFVTFDGGQSLYTTRNLTSNVQSSSTEPPLSSLSSSSLLASSSMKTRSSTLHAASAGEHHQKKLHHKVPPVDKSKTSKSDHGDVQTAAIKAVNQMKDIPPRFLALTGHLVGDKEPDTRGNGRKKQAGDFKTALVNKSPCGQDRTVVRHAGGEGWSSGLCNLTVRVNVNDKQGDSDSEILRDRLKKIMQKKPNGLFSTRLVKEYEEQFNEHPPSDIIEKLSSWPDIVTLERISLTNQIILYPAAKSFISSSQQPTASMISAAILPKPGDRLKVVVTMVYDCSDFFVHKMSAPFISLMERIQELTKHVHALPEMEELNTGTFIIAKFTDDIWYRAEIIQVNKRHGEVTYDVYYLDYGNTATVSATCVQHIPADLCILPAQAVRCSLSDCYPTEETWKAESISEFKLLTMNMSAPFQLVMDVIHVESDHLCTVRLYDINNLDIAGYLIDKGLALPAHIASDPSPLHYPDCLDWDVFVCYVNTTTDIIVRLVGDETSEKLADLEHSLAMLAKQPSVDLHVDYNLLSVGQVYMIAADEEEETYSRVRIKRIHTEKVRVEYVDHGDVEVIDVKHLRLLPPEYNQLPYQAIPAKLTGLESFRDNDTVRKNLIELTLGKTFVAAVDNRGHPISLTLWDTSNEGVDKNINELIALVLDVDELELRLPEVGGTVEGYASYVSENGHIYFQILGPGLKTLAHATAVMGERCDNCCGIDVCIKHPKKGELYWARYMNSWLRVEVMDVIPDQQVSVRFVDYGNICVIDQKLLHVITGRMTAIRDLPYQALECILFRLPPAGYVWTDHALDFVVKMAPEDEVRILKVISLGTPPQVELFFHDNKTDIISINELVSNELHLFQKQENLNEADVVSLEASTEHLTLDAAQVSVNISNTAASYTPNTTALTLISDRVQRTDVTPRSSMSNLTSNVSGTNITTDADCTLPTNITSDASIRQTAGRMSDTGGIFSCVNGTSRTDVVASSHDVSADMDHLRATLLPQALTLPRSGDEVFITWVDDPRNIWAVVYSQYPAMCEMMDQIQNYFKKDYPSTDVIDVVEGGLYAALYGDIWYRVVIKSVSPENNQVTVHFVDYGDTASLDISLVCVLPTCFRKLPFQAFSCRLEGVNPVGDEDTWPKEIVERIRELIQEKVFTAWIMSGSKFPHSTTDPIPVTLADFSQSSTKCFIHKILVDKGLAK